MKKISARKLKRILLKYRKTSVFMAMMLVVGIGLFVANVFAVTLSLFGENWSPDPNNNNYYNLGVVGERHELRTRISGDTTSGFGRNDFDWTTDKVNIVNVVKDDTPPPVGAAIPINAFVTGKAAGFANVTVRYVVDNTTASTTVFLPLISRLTAPDGTEINESNTRSYEAGDTFTIRGDNVVAANPLSCSVRRYDGTEIANSTRPTVSTDDVAIEIVDEATIKVTFNTSGRYTIRAYTADYMDNTSITALRKDYDVNIKVKFKEDVEPPVTQGRFLTIRTTPSGRKYCVVPDVINTYALMTNASDKGAPSAYGIGWKSNNENVAEVVPASGSVYNMIKGKYAGIARIDAGLSAVDVSGASFLLDYDECYAIVPFIWSMDGFNTVNGFADKDITMNVNDSYTLTTSGEPKYVSWQLMNNSTADASVTNGVFTASKEGDYIVHAILDGSQFPLDAELVGQMGASTIEIKIHVIDSFGISEERHSMYVGESFLLKAITTDPTIPVEFTVENQPPVTGGEVPTGTLATLKNYEENGVVIGTEVTGVKEGIVKVTAKQVVNNVVKTASCYVYILEKPIEVTSISIDPPNIQIDRGSTAILTAVFNRNNSTPENMNVLWSSSDPSIVTVSGNGNLNTATINGVKGGRAVIMVVSQDGLQSATCTVDVREPVTGITLNETNVTASLTQRQLQLVPTITPAGDGVNRNVTWESTNPSVLTVDRNGLVSYRGPGYASVVCTTEDGAYQAYCNFYINIPVETLTLDYTDVIMSINEQLRITAEVLPINATQRVISWESSDTSVCTVDSNGLVKAMGVGYATILAKTIDGSELTAMCKVYVKQPVTSVALNVKEIEVRKGATFWLYATCLPENADNKLCEWTSSDTDICTVDKDGKVEAVGSGTCNIVCTNVDTGISDYCVVTVTQPVTGLTLNSDYQEMWVGSKYAIIPNVLPIDADNKKVTYETSDESVATVDEDGIVTAVKGGSCVIIVTTDECHLKASVTINVKEYVSSIELSEHEKFLNIGATGTLTAKVGSDTATNKAVVWTSSNSTICSVVDGTIYGAYPGVAVITVTAADGSGVTDTCIVRVVNPVTSITIEPEEVRILVGDYYKLRANILPADATVKDLRWVSSNEAVATVDSDGEVLGVGVGKCRITAYSMDGNEVKGSCSVYVSPVVKISSLKINSSEITMLTGKTRQLRTFITPTNTTESVDWYSTDTSIVVVDSNGTITTVGPGIADVVVYGGTTNVSASCRVHSLALSKTSIDLGQYDIFDLAVDGAQGFNVAWRTSNPRVATVDNTGHVVARMRGTTTITATVDNKTLTCVVNVGTLY